MFDVNVLKGLSLSELKAVREAVAFESKAVKEAETKARIAEKAADEAIIEKDAREKAVVGSTIVFYLKQKERTAVIVKLNEHTVTVNLEEGIRYIPYKKFIVV